MCNNTLVNGRNTDTVLCSSLSIHKNPTTIIVVAGRVVARIVRVTEKMIVHVVRERVST